MTNDIECWSAYHLAISKFFPTRHMWFTKASRFKDMALVLTKEDIDPYVYMDFHLGVWEGMRLPSPEMLAKSHYVVLFKTSSMEAR